MTPCETRSVVSTGGDYSVFGARKMHAMRGRPEIAERHGAGHVARCTARAAHARHGSARHPPRQVTAHHPVRAAGAVPGRPGEPSLRRFQAERAVGVGHHICAYFQRLGVRGLRDGRLLPAGHRPADLHEPVRGPGRRRPENGRLGAPARSLSMFLCKRVRSEMGVDSVGVGGGELGQGLLPVGGDLSLDESALGPARVGGRVLLLGALRGPAVLDVADPPATAVRAAASSEGKWPRFLVTLRSW